MRAPDLPAVGTTQELWRGKVEQISWRPRAFLYHNFLSEEECEHLKELAAPHLAKSTVVDNESGKSVDSNVRTSSGMFLTKHQDEVVSRIEKRISHITMIPEGGCWVGAVLCTSCPYAALPHCPPASGTGNPMCSCTHFALWLLQRTARASRS